jgi:DNA invertase Pin-like site-specific DNA recombinase
MAAVRSCHTLVVTKLDRHARSLPEARDIADELTQKGVALSLGGSIYDPADAVGRLLFDVLGMVAEFEADLIRMGTREGMAIAKAKGKLRGKQPTITAANADTCQPSTLPARTPRTNWRNSSTSLAQPPTVNSNAHNQPKSDGRRGRPPCCAPPSNPK